jgi:hypothetical protein
MGISDSAGIAVKDVISKGGHEMKILRQQRRTITMYI